MSKTIFQSDAVIFCLVLCNTTPCFVLPSICWLVCHHSMFCFIFVLWAHCSWANDLKYGHYPPSHDWCSSVSGLVLELVSQVIMFKSLFMNVVGQAEAWSWSRNPHANTKELQWTWNCFHVLNLTFVCHVGFRITAKHSNPRYWVVWEVGQYPSLYPNWKILKKALWDFSD